MTDDDTVPASRRAIWERRQAHILARVSRLERILTTSAGGLEESARAEAEREAHRLAGSLGTFGFAEGSELARQIEHVLEAVPPLDAKPLPQLCALVAALVQSLPHATAPLPLAELADPRSLIVVVTGDRELAEGLALEAESRGMRVVALNGSDPVLNACRHDPPVAVLVDLRGEQRTEEIFSLVEISAGEEQPIPLFVLNGEANFTDRAEFARCGAPGFLHESLSAAEIVDRIGQTSRLADRAATTVLAVDDDADLLAALTAVISDAGHRVVTLVDPLRFWEVLEESRPDLILLDLDMPGVNGLELCRAVRQDPRWKALPVMFLTRSTDRESIRDIFTAGADDYVAKPIVGPELSARISNRMERVKLYRALADTDSLTGLFNRRKSQELLDRLVLLAGRYRQPLSLAVLDLDRFKQVNDRHGHAAGDAVLRRVGELLGRAFRGEDVAARWGGEEFVVVTYGMAKHDAVARLAEVLEQFRRERFSGKDGDFQVTFSAGVAEYGVDGDNVDGTYRAADEVLYWAKASGRDRVLAAGWQANAVPETPDVVVVEDDEIIGRLLQTALRDRGYTVSWIRDGAVAADTVSALRPRVVLLDIVLPGLTGIEVLRRLADEGTLARTRVIMVTGSECDDQAVLALKLGACDHVIKPFKLPVLLERVRRSFEA